MLRWACSSSVVLFAVACGGGDLQQAQRNRVFYEQSMVGAVNTTEYESRFPPLDQQSVPDLPEYIGVEVLNSNVRISRPSNWIIRAGSNEPGRRYVQYVSPQEYIVSLYEWFERPDTPWHDVLARYKKDVKERGAELARDAVPMAVWNGQGRSCLVRRKVPGAKGAFETLSREYLVRSDNRVALVQIIYPTSGLAPVAPELRRVLETLQLR